MFVYLGSDVVVEDSEIIGIFDIERVTVDRYMKDYLNAVQKKGMVYYVSLDMPKCFVVCTDTVYVTNVSGDTIKKRFKAAKTELKQSLPRRESR